jgi:transposase InsO family protein
MLTRGAHVSLPFSLFPNALKSLVITGPEQVWVSDTTCLSIDRRHYFLAVVTDAYSRKIMGWSLGERNTSELACTALEQALASREYPERELIHHSDRSDHSVKREDCVQDDDLRDDQPEAGDDAVGPAMLHAAFEALVQFHRGLENQKQATDDNEKRGCNVRRYAR